MLAGQRSFLIIMIEELIKLARRFFIMQYCSLLAWFEMKQTTVLIERTEYNSLEYFQKKELLVEPSKPAIFSGFCRWTFSLIRALHYEIEYDYFSSLPFVASMSVVPLRRCNFANFWGFASWNVKLLWSHITLSDISRAFSMTLASPSMSIWHERLSCVGSV